MKKIMTGSNLWFFTTIISLLAWAVGAGGFWSIFACSSFVFGAIAKKKEKDSNKEE